MEIWHYHPESGAVLGQSTADPSPLETGVFLVPAHATATPPPSVAAGQQAIWSSGEWAVVPMPSSDTAPPPLDALKDAARSAIRAKFDPEANANVTALGITWQGGIDSALKLDAAKRLAEAVGATTVEFFDADDLGHDLSMADATAVTIAVGVAYQTALAKKKATFRAIAAATSQAELDAITWS